MEAVRCGMEAVDKTFWLGGNKQWAGYHISLK